LFDGLLVDIANRFELLREHQQGRLQVDEAPGVCARADGAGYPDRWLALDVNRSAFMNGPSTYDARLLLLESPTPRARTYADRPSELSREVTLVGEAALCGHIGERQPVIAQLFLG
jgi:hypothetical protein